MEVIKCYRAMTPKQIEAAAEAMAVIILAHIKAKRKREAECSAIRPQTQEMEKVTDEANDPL